MENLKAKLLAYTPCCEQEARDLEMMLYALERLESPLTRDNAIAHFSASSWIVNPDRTKALMAWHNIYRSWTWSGGHADGEADLLKVALREAREETGLRVIEPVLSGNYSVEVLPVNAHVKRGRFVSAHLHLNATFLLTADDTQQIHCKPDENSGVQWMPLDQAADVREEPFMALIYSKLNRKLADI